MFVRECIYACLAASSARVVEHVCVAVQPVELEHPGYSNARSTRAAWEFAPSRTLALCGYGAEADSEAASFVHGQHGLGA